MSCKCKNYLTSIGKPKNKIERIAWLLLNVFGCKFCETCRDKPCNIKEGECCTDNIANYIREAVKEETLTTDVVEVVHAYWKETKHTTESKKGREIHSKLYNCSNCDAPNGRKKSSYCHWCGAKMDGERKEE